MASTRQSRDSLFIISIIFAKQNKTDETSMLAPNIKGDE
jgi:hypothetical protein